MCLANPKSATRAVPWASISTLAALKSLYDAGVIRLAQLLVVAQLEIRQAQLLVVAQLIGMSVKECQGRQSAYWRIQLSLHGAGGAGAAFP